MIIRNQGSTTVTGSCILNNWAAINGGGLYNDSKSLGATKVTGSSIVGNSATGPNTPGADTVGGNVDTSGYLTETILGCVFHLYLPWC